MGNTLDLTSFRGHPTLLLFWNPNCGFCANMLPDLQTWEARAPEGAPQLLVVSTGSVEANRALALRAPVVLSQDFSVGQAFKATGTPSAVLLDAEGRIASPVAVGAMAIMELAAGSDAFNHHDHNSL
jgi:thiol-disulfide isomerase/thioredoxin